MATTYDYNTGKALAPGQAQSVYNTQTGQKIGSSATNSTITPPNIDTNITSKNLNTNATSPLTVPTSNTSANTQNFINSTNAGVTTSLANAPLTEVQQEDKNVTDNSLAVDNQTQEIKNLMAQLGYKTNDTQNLQNQYNIPGLTNQLSDLKTQYAQTQSNFNNIIKQTQGQNIPSVLSGGQGALQQAIASTQLGGIAAQIQVAQGNLDAAEQTIKRTIDQKYGAIEDNINAQLKMYEINKDKLTTSQKVVADRKAGELEIKKYNLQTEKAQTTAAINDITAAAKSGQINASTGYKIASDLANGTITSAQAYAKLGMNSTTTGTSGLSSASLNNLSSTGQNEAFLATLSPGDATLVKKIANYEMDMSKVTSLRGDERTRIAKLVAQYDPTFDMNNYAARAKTRSDFTSGKNAQNIKQLNTAVGHLDSLSKAATALGNSSVPLWNKIANAGISAVGDPRVTTFNTAATAVESELASVFKGTGATDQEIKVWRENLNAAQSPAQLKAAVDTAIELMGSRLLALQSQYEVGMGKPKDFTFLNDKSREILQNLGVDVNQLDPQEASNQGGVLKSPDGTQQVNLSDLTPAQIEEARKAGWIQ